MRVTLTNGEMLACVLAGGMRQISAIRRGRRHAHDAPEDAPGWQWHIEGVLGEYAASVALDKCYRITPELDHAGDIGPYHVRSSEHAKPHLTIYRTDPDDAPFILVRESPPIFDVLGWAYARDAKRDRYVRANARSPSWWIPASDLIPIEDLIRQENRRRLEAQ